MNTSHKLNLWQGAALLATTLLGTGVFILPQLTIAQAGPFASWAWLLLTMLAGAAPCGGACTFCR
jgi:amino acid efflux transporter